MAGNTEVVVTNSEQSQQIINGLIEENDRLREKIARLEQELAEHVGCRQAGHVNSLDREEG